MAKQKTRKSVAKRFKITKTGKVLYRSQNLRHLRRKKKKNSLRAAKKPQILTGGMTRRIRRSMTY